jgi:hypothetical protein
LRSVRSATAALITPVLVLGMLLLEPVFESAEVSASGCADIVGPGIAPPAQVPSGLDGFHARWYGQRGYMNLCPDHQATATIAYFNSGSRGWVAGSMGESAYLGTWGPEPGQDKPSQLGGDGSAGTPNTGWPRPERIAAQPVGWVGPGQVAWFQFMVQAPSEPGWYRLYLRPLIEGTQWMENEGVYWQVVVLYPDGTVPPEPPPPPPPPEPEPEPEPERASDSTVARSAEGATGVTVIASWYGPGFYGNYTACGQVYTPYIQGVAHRWLPCGTMVTLAYAGNVVTVPVIDRGPFIPGREFDLSNATRISLACTDLCPVLWIE